MLTPPGECESCPMSDRALRELLTRYPCYELAAYHACMLLAQESAIRLADGTTAPSQRRYWLSMAQTFRPVRGGVLRRADEACPTGVEA